MICIIFHAPSSKIEPLFIETNMAIAPARHHLSPDAHKTLLNAILDSHEEPNEALRHPLHALLYIPKRQRTGFFSADSSTQSILDEIQQFMETERPLSIENQGLDELIESMYRE